MHSVVPLQFLKSGETAFVHEIDGDQNLVTRLHEMGLQAGVRVQMVCAGEPCIIAIENHRLTFRSSETASVLVNIDGAAAEISQTVR